MIDRECLVKLFIKNCFACGSILIKYQENIPNLIDVGWISLKIGNK